MKMLLGAIMGAKHMLRQRIERYLIINTLFCRQKVCICWEQIYWQRLLAAKRNNTHSQLQLFSSICTPQEPLSDLEMVLLSCDISSVFERIEQLDCLSLELQWVRNCIKELTHHADPWNVY